MTIDEKQDYLTILVKEKLDTINYRITGIMSYYAENVMLRDLSYKNVIITSFREPMFGSSSSVITDPETMEMLYVRTGPTNFVDIEEFFAPEG